MANSNQFFIGLQNLAAGHLPKFKLFELET